MTEDLILTEESVASEEQAVSEAPKPAKKAYVTPQMEIEYFDVEDIITTSSGTSSGKYTAEGGEPDLDPGDLGEIGGDF